MVKFKRFLASVLVVLFALSLSDFGMVAFADDSASYTTDTNFWHWLSGGIHDNSIINYISNTFGIGSFLGYFHSTDVCANSQDNKHHASSVTGISDDGYCICVCDNCGNEFTSTTKASNAYDDYAASLPAQSVTSDGGFLWYPTVDDLEGNYFLMCLPKENITLISSAGYSYSAFSNTKSIVITNNGGRVFHVSYNYQSNSAGLGFCDVSFVVPVTGVYRLCEDTFVNGVFADSNGVAKSVNRLYSSASYNKSANQVLSFQYTADPRVLDSDNAFYEADFYFPVFEVTPLVSFNVTSTSDDDTYNIGTRSASISGNYGIITQSGDVQKIDSQTIVNEGNKTYYSPTTGDTVSFTDWSYDYSDRSYTLTTSGDTTTVTYGDEYITIQEGSTVTNIYYITETSSGGNSGGNGNGGNGSGGSSGNETPVNPAPHTHNYSSSVTTSPTCTLPGVRTYTCSCGNSYTENIPATGHVWIVKQQVNTQYDENGDLLTQGYTIYRCSVCGEEYREDSGTTLSPSNPLNTSQTSGIFTGIFGIFWDLISFMLTLFNDFIVGGIRNFLSSLLDSAGDFFSMLNPMNWF